jgi:pimeloyl-ACP methyl ester carboxylesterase/class 3 adenylate cyclase
MNGIVPGDKLDSMGSGPEIAYARTEDGLSIAYAMVGSGPVDILFVPGFVSHLGLIFDEEICGRFWRRLTAFARVIAFDKRGQGLSDRGEYTIENITADAIAVLDAAGVERASVFGISEGGPAATMMAALHPSRITRMVQFGTYARLSWAPDFPQGFNSEDQERFAARMRESWGDPDLLKLWAPSVADDPVVRRWWTQLLRWGAGPATAHTVTRMYNEMDVRPLLPLVRVPTLILWRAGDRLVPAAFSRDVAEGIPGAAGKELPGADHVPFAGEVDGLVDELELFLTGQPPSRPAQRVLSTVLFTDLVDSTRLAAEIGDRRWRALLEDSLQGWRRVVEAGRGRFVKSTGDGLLATFDGLAQAVRAAVEMRERARELGVETRSGIHTGECELIGEDVAGIAVHIAARVESKGRPGEVTTTGTVKDLVIGSGIEFDERGVHELKGVPGAWPLFAVSGDAEAG